MYSVSGTARVHYGASGRTVENECRVGESDIRTIGDDSSITVSPRVTRRRIAIRRTRQHVAHFERSAGWTHLYFGRTFYINT